MPAVLSHVLQSPWFQQAVTFVEVVGTVVGLFLAYRSLKLAEDSLRDGKALVADLRRVERDFQGIERSLSTRRVGRNPEYGDDVAKLVQRAKYSIEITAIFPVIAIYRAPYTWMRIESALKERQAAGVKIFLLFATWERRMEAVRLQFQEALDHWTRWSAQPDNAARLKLFAEIYKRLQPDFSTGQKFLEFILEVQDAIVAELFWRATVEYTDDFVPIISWIVDGSAAEAGVIDGPLVEAEAFFAINNGEGQSTGFITRDKSMILSIESVRSRYSRAGAARNTVVVVPEDKHL